jgi:hypothetical protein
MKKISIEINLYDGIQNNKRSNTFGGLSITQQIPLVSIKTAKINKFHFYKLILKINFKRVSNPCQ